MVISGRFCDFLPQFNPWQSDFYNCDGLLTEETGTTFRIPKVSVSSFEPHLLNLLVGAKILWFTLIFGLKLFDLGISILISISLKRYWYSNSREDQKEQGMYMCKQVRCLYIIKKKKLDVYKRNDKPRCFQDATLE